ncbi:LysR family transcriptional regulator [Streptomyces sp. NPDC059896]|uniref:LysR family transcriptional regulator n=1 Tax=Streptomyces sp. NPDC059896 TaxID=3346993 RepID=UPI00365CEA59
MSDPLSGDPGRHAPERPQVAAADTRVTASAVSQQLRLLEEETRTRLLERTGRSVRLTAAGRQLAEDTENVLTALEQARNRLRTGTGKPAGPLHFACFPSALVPLAAPLRDALENVHRDLRPHLTEAEPEAAVRPLLQRRVDIALVYRYTNLATPPHPGVETHTLRSDPLVAVLRGDHPAVRPDGSPIEPRELADTPWITAPPRTACGDAVLQACRSAGFTPRVRHTRTDFSAMIALAASGGHTVLIPRMATARLPRALSVRPVTDSSSPARSRPPSATAPPTNPRSPRASPRFTPSPPAARRTQRT